MLWVEEVYTNATENRGIGESGRYETFTDKRGVLYRSMQKEYGRCISKQYIDTANGVKATGWVFQGRQRYEDAKQSWPDADQTYLREVWVTVFDHTCPEHGANYVESCFRCLVAVRAC